MLISRNNRSISVPTPLITNLIERNKQLAEGSPTPSLGFEDLYSFEDYRPFIKDGCYTVPEKPGLGIELNDDVVKQYPREAKYIYKSGYFEPTPEFEEPMTLEEAQQKKTIGRGGWYNHGGPWVHLDEEGNLVNETGPR